MNKDNDVLSEYFEMGGCEDEYYTFRGGICCQLKGGVKNVLYGKRVNLSEMYNMMVDDIIGCIEDGLFEDNKLVNGVSGERVDKLYNVNKYTCDKYGISFEWVDCRLNGRMYGDDYSTDRIYECMIERVGGVDKIDWMRIYNMSKYFRTDNSDILVYIANSIISGDIYKYFVNRYKLRVSGVETISIKKRGVAYNEKRIVLEWEGGIKLIKLSDMIKVKRDWWHAMTNRVKRNRNKIIDYDKLLNGRSEDEILPNVCPIDSNIVLNYTTIDFSVNNNSNFGECKNYIDNGSNQKIWSFASIDRIDSTREYDYDNVEIISHYYNTQVKNCANPMQTGKLFTYQLNALLKNIDINRVKSMKTNELDYMFDVLSGTTNIFETLHNKQLILLNEMEKRYYNLTNSSDLV